jgi:putative radical SAM enzyme (TIGR03279 family)
MMDGILVERVLPGSVAEEMEIAPGDRLLSINSRPRRDIIDYLYNCNDEEITLEIVKPDGEVWEIELEQEEGEPLGLTFTPPEPAECGNKCVFCFVHQLPRGLRSPLYVKDEDYRLSFLYGNYVTLANIGSAEMSRIKEQRLSPLYISVHSTDPAIREELLGTQGIRPILEVMKELADARITMHTQVVICPGINDGAALERTVADLSALHPWVESLAVVPVGLTMHRKGLPKLTPVTAKYAVAFIATMQRQADLLAKRLGSPFLYLADEFYIKAGLPFPPLATYGDLPQLENGVGMVPLFLAEAEEVLAEAEPLKPRTVTIVTGESPFRYIVDFLSALERITGVHCRPVAVGNRLFGNNVTVTGLLAGQDIATALQGENLGERVLIPDVMLKEGEGVFLDDMPVADLEKLLGVKTMVVESTPAGIYRALREDGQKHRK